jgi:hypothetical protein
MALQHQSATYVSVLERRISILTKDGKLLARWSSPEQNNKNALFIAPHAITSDSKGDIYVADVAAALSMYHNIVGVDRKARAIQKFARITK